MRRSKRRAKPGFALLEALVFVILMLLLSAAMLAAAYNLHRRSVERIENDRAYNAAVAALKMVGNAIAGGADPAAYEAEATYTLDVTPEGEAQQGYAQITMKGQVGKLTSNGETFEGVRLTAVATVAGETETVQLTLQKAKAEAYPHTLYGAGFAGRISSPPTLTLGPDTDLYLYGGGAAAELSGLTAGGNVAVQGAGLTLRDSSVAGSVVSDGPVTLENTVVGGGTAGASPSQDRLANVYSSASVALATGAKIYGDVYAPLVSSRGGVELLASAAGDHSIYSAERKLDEFTVFEAGGTGHLTTEQALSRTGTLTFSGAGKWVTVAPDSLKSPFSADGSPLRMFVPNFPVTLAPTIVASSLTASAAPPSGALNSQGALYQVASGGHLTLNSAAPDATGKPAVFVVLAQNATLTLAGTGPFYLCVYGAGPNENSVVKVLGGAQIYGSLQGVDLDMILPHGSPNSLAINYVQPYLAEYQSPSSAGYSADAWRVVGYERLS